MLKQIFGKMHRFCGARRSDFLQSERRIFVKTQIVVDKHALA